MTKLKEISKLGTLESFAISFMADFRFGPLNIMILVILNLIGLIVHLLVYPFQLEVVITMVGAALILAIVFRLSQIWESVLIITTLTALAVYLRHRPESWILVIAVVVAGLVCPLASKWLTSGRKRWSSGSVGSGGSVGPGFMW
jgi:hypothetical protein